MRAAFCIAVSVLASGCATTAEPEVHGVEEAGAMVGFTWTPAEPLVGERVQFIPDARVPSGSEPASWFWDFGDGNTSQDAKPAHAFDSEGVHVVRVVLELGDHTRLQHAEDIEVRPRGATASPEQEGPQPDDPPSVPTAIPEAGDTRPRKAYVTVATFDSGVNPYHPAWRINEDPTAYLPGFPQDAVRVHLALGTDPSADRAASTEEWERVLAHDGRPVVFNGTRIVAARSATTDSAPFYDHAGGDHMHGARASSQIAATGYAVGDNALVVAMDFSGGVASDTYEGFIEKQMEWVLQQDWIDIIHINMALPVPYPLDTGVISALSGAVDNGRLVVLAGGNGLGNGGPPYPMETQHTTGAPGTLVVGANDQCAAGASWSNLNPHIVMDGLGTIAAHETSYGDAPFSGTSSSSPRVAGYAAELLYQARMHFNHTGGLADGALLVVPKGTQFPEKGPLADGRMDAREFHEVIRKTAEWPHESSLDGSTFLGSCPGAPDPGVPLYAKYGYGEVSEKTLPHALDVILGKSPMPDRTQEDVWYGLSEEIRETLHD